MMHWGSTTSRQGFLNTGRLLGWGVFLVIAGIAAPSLRTGKATSWASHTAHSADTRAEHTTLGVDLDAVADRFRAVTTRSRMRGIRAELKMWTERHGTDPTGALTDLVGKRTATDPWGRPMSYIAPTGSSRGWLRSKGPNPKTDKDDIWLPLALSDFH